MIGLVMNDLEKAIVNSMLGFGDTFRANFGAFTRVEDKVGNQDPNDVVTSTDRESQEAILQAIFKVNPNMAISVEECLNKPTEVQAALYANDGTSNELVGIDGVDGTYAFGHGIRDDSGIIANEMRRDPNDRNSGRFAFAAFYYPKLRQLIIANENLVYAIREDDLAVKFKLKVLPSRNKSKVYSAARIMHDREREILRETGIRDEQFVPDIYSYTQLLQGLINGDVNGCILPRAHVYDGSAVAWTAQKLGFDVEYSDGRPFGLLPFGDRIVDGKRVWPYDENGLLIIGRKNDGMFSKYQKKAA